MSSATSTEAMARRRGQMKLAWSTVRCWMKSTSSRTRRSSSPFEGGQDFPQRRGSRSFCQPGGVMNHVEAGNRHCSVILQGVPSGCVKDVRIVGSDKETLPGRVTIRISEQSHPQQMAFRQDGSPDGYPARRIRVDQLC